LREFILEAMRRIHEHETLHQKSLPASDTLPYSIGFSDDWTVSRQLDDLFQMSLNRDPRSLDISIFLSEACADRHLTLLELTGFCYEMRNQYPTQGCWQELISKWKHVAIAAERRGRKRARYVDLYGPEEGKQGVLELGNSKETSPIYYLP